jgi:CysZ protein
MIAWFIRAVAQLGDANFRRPLLLGLVGAILVFALLWAGFAYVLTLTWFATSWIETAVDALGGVAAFILTVLLYPVVAAAILSLFVDSAIDAVEAKHYPDLPPARPQAITEQVSAGLRLLGLALLLNLLALPLYLIPFINMMVFYGLNGYILGREYFEMVAARRLEPEARRRLRRECRLKWFAMGVVIAFLATLPVINLVAPLIAAGAMTHAFMEWRVRLSR